MQDPALKTDYAASPETILGSLDFLGLPALVVGSGLVKESNPAALKAFLYTPFEISGKRIGALIPALEGVGPSSMEKFEAWCVRKDGEGFIAEVSVLPGDHGGVRVFVFRDITAIRKLEEKALQRTKEINAFSALTNAVSRSMETGRIASEAVSMMVDVMHADGGWMYVMDEETGELCLHAYKGLTENFFKDISRIKPSEYFSGRAASSGRPLLVKKASEDPRVDKARMDEAGIQSLAGVPVMSKGSVLGVLGVASRRPANFTSMDMKLLVTLGNHIGIALENAKLFTKLTEKVQQIGLISEAAGIINSSLSIGTVFRLLASETKKMVGYDRASVNLMDSGGKMMHIFALDTTMNTRLKRGTKAPVEGTSSGWVTTNNKPWINRDLASEVAFPLDERLLKEGIRSTISIPLFHERILGSFNLDSIRPEAYSNNDLEILVPVARHISIAIENAMLFEEIAREKKEWERTFDAITDMVWIQGPRQDILRANQSVLKRVALPYKEIVGKNCAVILRGLGIDPCQCPCPKTTDCKEPTFREVSDARGNTYHFWTYPLLGDDGRQFALVNYCKDVTGQKKLEQHVLRSDKLASLGTLAAGIAHEINNPMGIIAGYSEALIERSKDKRLLRVKEFGDFPEYLETINNEIFRCKNILNGLLDFSRPTEWSPTDVDINEVLREVLLLVRHKADKAEQVVSLQLAEGLPRLTAEPGQLRQLFMNIIINSLYFMPRGGRVVIGTALSGDGGHIETRIADNGCGIPGELINKIFDPFFTTKPLQEGTGLGLAICHRIVENHDGKIEVESELGRGTAFTVSLPVGDIHAKRKD